MIARRVFTAAALTAAIAAVAIVVLGGGTPYKLNLIFQSASQLVSGNQVKVGGVPIGTVSSISLTPNGQADVEVSIDSGGFDPLHAGTTAAVRISSLSSVANRFISLDPGPNNAPAIRDGGVIGTDHTRSQVDVDAFQSTLDAQTRQALQWLIHGGAVAYEGSGPELNKGIVALDPALNELQSMIHEISDDDQAFDRFIVSGATVVQAVAAHQQDLQGGLAQAATTAQAVAEERTAINGILARAPATLTHATRTLNNTTSTLGAIQPVARQLLPVAPRLTTFFEKLSPVLHQAVPVLGQVQGLLPNLRSALVGLPGLKKAALPAFKAATGAIAASQHIIEGALPYVPDIIIGNTNGFAGTAGGYYDANGDYARIAVVGGPFTASGLATLLPAPTFGYSQHNVERCPGAATQVAPDSSNLWTSLPSSITCKESERP
jgi:phospholipid/cholesterol/gamma-HCH transport system substrate-binding protein